MKTRRIPFVKLHGAGNDFVFLNREETRFPVTKSLARLLLDRHFGIGGDQLLVYAPATPGRLPSLEIYNGDGSRAEVCGNGVRATAYYLREFKNLSRDFSLKTDSGPVHVRLGKEKIDVDLGEPILEGREIPVRMRGPVVNKVLKVGGQSVRIHAVSMGNPHCVIFVKNVVSYPVKELGSQIERHPFFPKRVNVEFVQVHTRGHLRARVWERGAGETLACGSGACAIGVAGARFGVTSRNVKIDLPGGRLTVRWGKDNHVYLSGPAAVTYSGVFLVS